MFGKGKKSVFSDTEISWGDNYLRINGSFLETGGVIGEFRVPINAIETVVIETLEPIESFNPIKMQKILLLQELV